MTIEDVIPMHAEFPVWVSEFSLGEEEGAREKCWAGVGTFVDEAESDDVEDLVCLAFNTRKQASALFLQKFRAVFHDANPEAVLLGNDREVEVLAGCCLVVLLNSDDTELAAWVALSITTTSAGGGRKHKLPMDIVGLAESALIRLSESNSERPDLTKHATTVAPNLNLENAITKAQVQFDAAGIAEAFTLAETAIGITLKTIVSQHYLTAMAANTFIKQQDEELQMLWWLTGGRSIDEDCAFNNVEKKYQPLLFAKELADQTEVLPGPGSVKGLLSRAGLKDTEKLILHDAINSTDAVWLSKLAEDIDPSPVTQPIHFAIKRQLETGAGDAWIAGWAAATELNANLSFSPLALGNLFYRERLLELFSGE